jgi:hypothetical protein
MTQLVTEQMRKKWAPVLEAKATDDKTKALSKGDIVTRLMENQENWIKSNQALIEAAAPGNATGAAVATWSPVLIKMVKRTVPNLIAMDFFGTQPLSTPDGLIFAMRARYNGPANTNAEAFYQSIQSGFSGNGTADAGDPAGFPQFLWNAAAPTSATGKDTPAANPAFGKGMATSALETLGSQGGTAWGKMGVSIEKQSVTAVGRGLYADYSHELRQDMQAVHGEDVDAILSDMLVTEIQSEMNREFIRTMNLAGKLGCAAGTSVPGVFNLAADSDGRWLLERLKSLMFRIEKEANAVALDTRRGKANRLLCSPNVASALAMSGMLDFTPALAANAGLEVDPTGQTFAGVLANGMRVYIDPYAGFDYITVAFKGATEIDAGIFFAPYTPLEMYRTVGEDSFQPRIAFKTRYGVVANPFYAQAADGTVATGKGLGQGENGYFRKFAVLGVNG